MFAKKQKKKNFFRIKNIFKFHKAILVYQSAFNFRKKKKKNPLSKAIFIIKV